MPQSFKRILRTCRQKDGENGYKVISGQDLRNWHGDICARFDMNDMGKRFERWFGGMSFSVPLLAAS